MISALDYFSALVQQDEDFPLFEAALAIAQDADPWLDFGAVQETVDSFAAQLQRRLPADASDIQKLRMLNHYFYNELGFAGNVNDYYAPANSYLQRVIETRRGIPISLAVVYMEIALQIGLEVRGVAFPGHFLMKLSIPAGEIILDPFNGISLSREELEERLEPYLGHYHHPELSLAAYLQTVPPRAILARMLHNLKALFSENQDWERMLEVQQRLVILLPGEVTERRDRGLAYAHLECPQAALEDLQAYLSECPYATDAQSLRVRLSELRRASRGLN
ncbi:regulator of sirC expression with transglutaminase-like and TPR domain [Paucimonas lemoignei]|uniref:Regulator of sirC expression with transglutaminase-like and TPR domain n=1 Tax=Paucimonas lemoignei TaxID=29443 RepID=A0A4R3I0X7_PAULE|nr:tetratricopeptide repeat protein [Paucimonas lemoignei]TCS38643.1 regulator of sirC expression with transglutaminase-like and TPR domain [Paucimonas lemoignei]